MPDHHPGIGARDDQGILATNAPPRQFGPEPAGENPGRDQTEPPVDPASNAGHHRDEEDRRAVGPHASGEKVQGPGGGRGLRQTVAGEQHDAHLKREFQETRVPDAVQPHRRHRWGAVQPAGLTEVGRTRKDHRDEDHEQCQPTSDDHRVRQNPPRDACEELSQSFHGVAAPPGRGAEYNAPGRHENGRPAPALSRKTRFTARKRSIYLTIRNS